MTQRMIAETTLVRVESFNVVSFSRGAFAASCLCVRGRRRVGATAKRDVAPYTGAPVATPDFVSLAVGFVGAAAGASGFFPYVLARGVTRLVSTDA